MSSINFSIWSYLFLGLNTERLYESLERAKTYAVLTPIYHDPQNDDYYYPKLALMEEKPVGRQTIEGHFDFVYNQTRNQYFEPIIGEWYIKVESPEEFQRLRSQTIQSSIEEILEGRRKVRPIYNDLEAKCLYYPEMALFEIEQRVREMIEGSINWEYDEAEKCYWAPSGEKYIKVSVMCYSFWTAY